MMADYGGELGTNRSQRHWRLVTVQAGGGLTVVRQHVRHPQAERFFVAVHTPTYGQLAVNGKKSHSLDELPA